MSYSRREFSKLALAGLPAAALIDTPLLGSSLWQARPNSVVKGVQLGIITYSYGGMPDQTGEATLKYVLDSGFSGIELMDGPAELFAGRPAAAPRGGGAGLAGGGGRGAGAPGAPPPAAPAATGATPPAGTPPAAAGGRAAGAGGGGGGRGPGLPEGAEYRGQPCASLGRGGAGQGRAGGGGGGRAAGVPPTPEQVAEQQAAQREATQKLKDWRSTVSMDRFRQLRKMYNDAGVTIYAYKPDGLQKNLQTSDEEWNYVFSVAAVLGATHLTMELPGGQDAEAMLKRVAPFAEKHKVYAAYHTHAQGSLTAFDQALALSKANMCAVDLGHFVAAGSPGGTPVELLQKYHDRTLSFHIKDRTSPMHCSLTTPFGEGDVQIKEILDAVVKNKWKMIPTVELEYPVPAGSDKVQEAKKCLDFCRAALA
jgi:sugar phosphate isomerase/epimerase